MTRRVSRHCEATQWLWQSSGRADISDGWIATSLALLAMTAIYVTMPITFKKDTNVIDVC